MFLSKRTHQITKVALLSLLTVFSLSLTGCSTRFGDPADVEYDLTSSPYHVVRRGETIASIAKFYGMDKRDLARLNGLKPPYVIVIGQKLVIRPLGNKRTQSGDPFDKPAIERSLATKGEVMASTLAPLPGTHEDNARIIGQPFSNPNEMQGESFGTSEGQTQIEENTIKQSLPSAPRAAAFYSWPVKGRIIKGFSDGRGGKPVHKGIRIAAPKGTPVLATNNGVVVNKHQIPNYGKVVLLKHDQGYFSVYSHLDEAIVNKGDVVQAGQKIGTVGKTGNIQEPQLYFEIRKNPGKVPVDPVKLLD